MGQSSLLTHALPVVIRFAFAQLLRTSSRAGGATREMLNRYIGGGRKRDQTTDLHGIENS
jgi:hypothetical protein